MQKNNLTTIKVYNFKNVHTTCRNFAYTKTCHHGTVVCKHSCQVVYKYVGIEVKKFVITMLTPNKLKQP